MSRALPVHSLITKGTWQIDTYHNLTRDKSFIGGHAYTDKAPLSTVVTLLFSYFLIDMHEYVSRAIFYSYLGSIMTIGGVVASALFFTLIMVLALLVASKNDYFKMLDLAIPISVVFYSSNLFIYSGVLWGHLLAAFFLVFSHYLLLFKKHFFYSGVSLGFGVTAEYPLALIAIVWTFQILLSERNRSPFNKLRNWLFGLAIPVIFLMYYHYLFTGNPLKPLYFYVASDQFIQMRQNLGLSFPSILVTLKLLFSPNHGLLFFSPVLLLFVPALYFTRKAVKQKSSFVLSAFLSMLLMNSGYFMWAGGACHGPRHLIPAVALILFYFVEHIEIFIMKKRLFYTVCGVGIILNVMTKSVGTIYSATKTFSYFELIIPTFFKFKFQDENFLFNLNTISVGHMPLIWVVLFCSMLLSIFLASKFTKKIAE